MESTVETFVVGPLARGADEVTRLFRARPAIPSMGETTLARLID